MQCLSLWSLACLVLAPQNQPVPSLLRGCEVNCCRKASAVCRRPSLRRRETGGKAEDPSRCRLTSLHIGPASVQLSNQAVFRHFGPTAMAFLFVLLLSGVNRSMVCKHDQIRAGQVQVVRGGRSRSRTAFFRGGKDSNTVRFDSAGNGGNPRVCFRSPQRAPSRGSLGCSTRALQPPEGPPPRLPPMLACGLLLTLGWKRSVSSYLRRPTHV